MKKKVVGIFLCCLFSCANSTSQKENDQVQFSKIEIVYVDFDIETPIPIHCNVFEEIFADEIKRISIQDKKTLKRFQKELTSLKRDDNSKWLDTRIKIKIYDYNNEIIEEYCIGQFFLTNASGLNYFIFSDSFKGLLKELNVINEEY